MENPKRRNKFEKNDPSFTSTPNYYPVGVLGRPSIHHYDNSISPISKVKSNSSEDLSFDSAECENSLSDDDYESKSHEYDFSKHSHTPFPENEQPQNVDNWFWIIVMSIVAIISFIAVVGMSNEKLTMDTNGVISVTIKDLQNYFPLQSHFIWNAFESGIDEVKNFKKPSVFLILYENDAEETLDKILRDIAKYASCILNNNCELQPIILTDANLASERASLDYGYNINKYKQELEQKSIMIIKNLDKVPGKIAQAFHSMCDEYTPLVGKSVFFFTIKVKHLEDELTKTNLQIAEEILRNNWGDLEDDIFYPLFTRISSMVLKVVTEKKTNI